MSSTECAICLDSLKNNLSALRCGHTFHSDCIAKWLVNQSACPCCKKTANHRTHVIPLYIDLTQRSDAESSSHTDANSQGNEKQLQTSNHQLRGQLDSCANQLKESRLENERLRKEASAQASKIRSYRSLQSVIDLQRRLSTEDARDRMRHWAMLPRDELGLITASLFEKYRDLTGQMALHETQMEKNAGRISELKKRAKRAEQRLRSSTAAERSALHETIHKRLGRGPRGTTRIGESSSSSSAPISLDTNNSSDNETTDEELDSHTRMFKKRKALARAKSTSGPPIQLSSPVLVNGGSDLSTSALNLQIASPDRPTLRHNNHFSIIDISSDENDDET